MYWRLMADLRENMLMVVDFCMGLFTKYSPMWGFNAGKLWLKGVNFHLNRVFLNFYLQLHYRMNIFFFFCSSLLFIEVFQSKTSGYI